MIKHFVNSIGKKNNLLNRPKSRKKDQVIWGQPANDKVITKPTNDSAYGVTHEMKGSHPNLMCLVLFQTGEGTLSIKMNKKNNCLNIAKS